MPEAAKLYIYIYKEAQTTAQSYAKYGKLKDGARRDRSREVDNIIQHEVQ